MLSSYQASWPWLTIKGSALPPAGSGNSLSSTSCQKRKFLKNATHPTPTDMEWCEGWCFVNKQTTYKPQVHIKTSKPSWQYYFAVLKSLWSCNKKERLGFLAGNFPNSSNHDYRQLEWSGGGGRNKCSLQAPGMECWAYEGQGEARELWITWSQEPMVKVKQEGGNCSAFIQTYKASKKLIQLSKQMAVVQSDNLANWI